MRLKEKLFHAQEAVLKYACTEAGTSTTVLNKLNGGNNHEENYHIGFGCCNDIRFDSIAEGRF